MWGWGWVRVCVFVCVRVCECVCVICQCKHMSTCPHTNIVSISKSVGFYGQL